MKVRMQLFITGLVVLKLIVGFMFIWQLGFDAFFVESKALASDLTGDEKPQQIENTGSADNGVDITHLVRRKNELEDQARRLEKRKAELIAIQEEINRKIEALNQLRAEIKSDVAQFRAEVKSDAEKKKSVEGQRLKHLIKAYTAMKPQSAAKLIEKLDAELAIELLSNMKGDVVGNILSFLDVGKAARISEGLVSRK